MENIAAVKSNGQLPEQLETVLSIEQEFKWIESLIKFRINELCGIEQKPGLPPIPSLEANAHAYFNTLIEMQPDVMERVALTLSLAACTAPQYLNYLYAKNEYTDRIFSEFGILEGERDLKMIPTWQTVLFLCYGSDINSYFQRSGYIHSDHRLYAEKYLLMPMEPVENIFLTPLRLNKDLLQAWLYPEHLRHLADPFFPAHEITSGLNWEDLIISSETELGLMQLRLWLRHGEALLNDERFAKYLNNGIRVLFYGPSGTGKTLTASLLGKEFQLPVYRVDLSQMVSKWIGETEKNLARVFDMAEKQGWILFFDEAEALFSARGEVNNSNDRRANQEVSYLLQRVENFDGTIIMATNLRDNIDDAFIRRFQLMINFPVPDLDTRIRLWKSLLENTFPLADDLSIERIAQDFEITGGSMKNAFRAVMLKVFDMPPSEQCISREILYRAIRYECSKDGIYTIERNY